MVNEEQRKRYLFEEFETSYIWKDIELWRSIFRSMIDKNLKNLSQRSSKKNGKLKNLGLGLFNKFKSIIN